MVLADTHLRAGRSDALIATLGERLLRADAIFHAGDITDVSVLDALNRHAPVIAVRGNNDVDLDLPETIVTDAAGVTVGMVHDSGSARGRRERLIEAFPDADVVLFGHSHLPWNESHETATGCQIHFNPGSPTQRRRAPTRTLGWIERSGDGVLSCRHEVI